MGWLHILGSDSFHPCRFSRVWTIDEKSKVVYPKRFRADNVICSFGTFLLPAACLISDNEVAEQWVLAFWPPNVAVAAKCPQNPNSGTLKYRQGPGTLHSLDGLTGNCFSAATRCCACFMFSFCLTCWRYWRATLCTPQSNQANRAAENNENHLNHLFYHNSI